MFNKTGFSLMELLIVIAVIGTLAGIILVTINPMVQMQKARDSQRKNHFRMIEEALERYYVDNGKYPQAGGCAYGASACYVYSSAGSNWIPGLVPYYMKAVPVDPLNNAGCCPWDVNNNNHVYAYGNVSPDGKQYDLTARLENTSDLDRCGVKNYGWFWDMSPWPWCLAFGGFYSNQIYERSPNTQ